MAFVASATSHLASPHWPIGIESTMNIGVYRLEVAAGVVFSEGALAVAHLAVGPVARDHAVGLPAARRPILPWMLPPRQVGASRAARWPPQHGIDSAPIPFHHSLLRTTIHTTAIRTQVIVTRAGKGDMVAALFVMVPMLGVRAGAGGTSAKGAGGEIITSATLPQIPYPFPKVSRHGPWRRRSRRVVVEGGAVEARRAARAAIAALARSGMAVTVGIGIAIGASFNPTQPLAFEPGALQGPPGITAPAHLAHPPGRPSSSLVPWPYTR